MMMLYCCSGTSEAAVGPRRSDRSGQVLPAVHGAGVPRRDDVVKRAGDPADEPRQHGAVAQGDGHQRPALV